MVTSDTRSRLGSGGGKAEKLTETSGFGGDANFHSEIAGEADGVGGKRRTVTLDFIQIGQVHPITQKPNHGSVFTLIQGEDCELAHTGREKAVGKGGWRAPLKMPQTGQSYFLL